MEITPPPVQIQSGPARQWWTWLVFAGLAGFFIATNMVGMFAMGSEEKDPLGELKTTAPVALKQYATFLELGEMLGTDQLDSTASTTLVQTRDQFEEKVGESDEAAEWVLAIDTILGNELNQDALDRLQLSDQEESVDMGDAFAGEISRPLVIEGDDVPAKVATWKVANPGVEEFPVSALGISANPVLFFGFLGWMGFVAVGGVVALALYAGLKFSGGLVAKGYQTGLTVPESDAYGGRMAIYFATFLLLSTLIAIPVFAFPDLNLDMAVMQAVLFVVLIGLIPVFSTIPLFGFKKKFGEILGDTKGIFGKLGWGFAGYMANFPLAIGVTVLVSPIAQFLPTPSHELIEQLMGSGPTSMALLFFIAAVGAPLVEEPMFRGVLFPAFQKIFRSPTTAIVLQGVIFAVIHPQGPLLWPALACIGMTAAVLTRQTGSLIPAILMHFLHNATIFGLNVVIR